MVRWLRRGHHTLILGGPLQRTWDARHRRLSGRRRRLACCWPAPARRLRQALWVSVSRGVWCFSLCPFNDKLGYVQHAQPVDDSFRDRAAQLLCRHRADHCAVDLEGR